MSTSTQVPAHVPTLVIGAGPAGLAVAASLKQRGLPALILEQSQQVGSAWRGHYDRLRLHTDKAHSALPGTPWPASAPRYPSRQQVVDYLEAYARTWALPIRFGQGVTRAHREGKSWVVQCGDQRWHSDTLVVAGGYNRHPNLPEWPGLNGYGGTVVHSGSYQNGKPYARQRVLVVGLGNSGGEIAVDLHEHGAQVSMAVRSAVNVIPKEIFGIPFLTFGISQQWMPPRMADALNAPLTRLLVGDLQALGLKRPAQGPITQIRTQGRVPFIDTGTIGLMRAGHVAVRPGIQQFTPRGEVFADGRAEDFDAVVLATGYRTGLGRWLEVSAGVLSPEGAPLCSGLPVAAEPGLYFCGYHVSATGMLREIALEAEQIAAHFNLPV
jgi:indole-3-pyruvate monooxygenase